MDSLNDAAVGANGDAENLTAWWVGMTDAEIERKAAHIYGNAYRFNHLPATDSRLSFVADVSGNADVSDRLTDADHADHGAYVNDVVSNLRATFVNLDAVNAARGSNRATRYTETFDALTSGIVEWSEETRMPVMATFAKALPVNAKTGKAISLQSARERWVRFQSAVAFDHNVWSALFNAKADRKARAAD